jgi:hypothetical protein
MGYLGQRPGKAVTPATQIYASKAKNWCTAFWRRCGWAKAGLS